MMDEEKKAAYKIVFDDLCKIETFTGKYDAEYGSNKFMFGINTVMCYIAINISKECYTEFDDLFFKNMIESERKVKGLRTEEYKPLEKWRCVEDANYAGGGYWECPSCKDRFSFKGFNMLNHMLYCPKCGSRVEVEEDEL